MGLRIQMYTTQVEREPSYMTRDAQPMPLQGQGKPGTAHEGSGDEKGKTEEKEGCKRRTDKRREARGKGRSLPELPLTSWQLLSNSQPPLASVLPGHPAQQLPPVFRDLMSLHTSSPTGAQQGRTGPRVPSDGLSSQLEECSCSFREKYLIHFSTELDNRQVLSTNPLIQGVMS